MCEVETLRHVENGAQRSCDLLGYHCGHARIDNASISSAQRLCDAPLWHSDALRLRPTAAHAHEKAPLSTPRRRSSVKSPFLSPPSTTMAFSVLPGARSPRASMMQAVRSSCPPPPACTLRAGSRTAVRSRSPSLRRIRAAASPAESGPSCSSGLLQALENLEKWCARRTLAGRWRRA